MIIPRAFFFPLSTETLFKRIIAGEEWTVQLGGGEFLQQGKLWLWDPGVAQDLVFIVVVMADFRNVLINLNTSVSSSVFSVFR